MIRPAEVRDAAGIAAILAREIRDGVAHFGAVPPTVDEIAAQIASTGRHPFRVAERSGEIAAFARASVWKPREAYAWTTELGVYVHPEHQRRGLGRRLVAEVVDASIDAGFRCLVAGIALPNPGSVALFEGLGFRPVGTFPAMGFKRGSWWDVGYWVRTVGSGRPSFDPA